MSASLRPFLLLIFSLLLFACTKARLAPQIAEEPPLACSPLQASLDLLWPRLPQEQAWSLWLSYEALAQTLEALPQLPILDGEGLKKNYRELGDYYGLNPAKRQAYRAIGLESRAGLGLFEYQGRLVLLLSLRDIDAFERWLKQILNEEFGRPRQSLALLEGWRLSTLSSQGNVRVALLSQGQSAYLLLPSSEQAPEELLAFAQNLLQTPKLANFDYARERSCLDQALFYWPQSAPLSAPFALYARLQAQAQDWQIQLHLASEAGVERELAKTRIHPALLRSKAPNRGLLLELSLPFGPMLARSLELLPEASHEKISALLNQLEQRLLQISFQKQILDNIRQLRYEVYSSDFSLLGDRKTPLAGRLMALPQLLRLSFAEAALSKDFFSKVQKLSRLLPEKWAEIRSHAERFELHPKVEPWQALSLIYAQGQLFLATSAAELQLAEALTEPPAEPPAEPAEEPQAALFLEACLTSAALSSLLGRSAEKALDPELKPCLRGQWLTEALGLKLRLTW